MSVKTEGGAERGGHAVFLSYAHADLEQAERLWKALELWGVPVWKDDRRLRAGETLDPAVQAAIEEARAFLLLGTEASLESEYVDREIGWALEVEGRSGGTFQVIPVRAGAGKKTLERAFGREGDRLYADATHGVEDAVPEILRALGSLPTVGGQAGPRPEPPPRDELILRFRKPRWATEGGKRRAAADLEIVHRPHGAAEGRTDGLAFESPLGPVELERLRWYLELYPLWSFGKELVNARDVEERLPEWGRALYDATLGHAEGAVERLLSAEGERRVVVEVLGGGEDGAASALLGLPWELLARGGSSGRDGDGYLFSGARAVRVVRRLPRERAMEPPPLARTLRVLLVVSRPNDVGYIDARESLTPLAEALSELGDRVDLHALPDATLLGLRAALKAAREARRPYQVVHFDGHGVYDPDQGLGMLVFEHPEDAGKVKRRKDLVGAKDLGEVLAEERVPLFVLEACQTAQAEEKAESSVAAGLLRAGVGSVVAMSHAVLVETARRFVEAFYPALARGRRIGAAMVEAQQALFADRRRNRRGQAEWTLHDWFVPVLFQDETGDVVLLPPGPLPEPGLVEQAEEHRLARTPGPPDHGFVGRSHELLRLLRLLQGHRAVALLGTGGQGKTALAAEAARWMLRVRRFERLAWVSAEHHSEARIVLDALGRQLVAGWTGVAAYEGPGGDLRLAIRKVQESLASWRVLMVVDNLETALEDPDPALLPMLAELAASGESRLLVTSRQSPVGLAAEPIRLDRLGAADGKALIEGVLKAKDLEPPAEGDAAEWVGRLVEVVRGHPRALVLLAPEVARRGLAATHDDLVPLMEELDKQAGTDADKRESSLLASVRLSLRRLTPEERHLVRGLAVFRQAAEIRILAQVLQVREEAPIQLCGRLVELGLGEMHQIGPLAFLLPDPALCLALAYGFGECETPSEKEREAWVLRWFENVARLIQFLAHPQADDRITRAVTRLALGELLAWVEAAEARVNASALAAEDVIELVGMIEGLLEHLGRQRPLARVVAARRRLAAGVSVLSHAGFEARRYELERTLQSGDVSRALRVAEALHRDFEAVGDGNYAELGYDQAMASKLLAQALYAAGAFAQAIPLLMRAREAFLALAKRYETAGVVASNCLDWQGDCLLGLGRLEEAAEVYETALAENAAAKRTRNIAVCKEHLGSVRMRQGRTSDAARLLQEARAAFEALDEPRSIATTWHQEGRAWLAARGESPVAA
jgi:tetratricopeptide (TPR) repeat protein